MSFKPECNKREEVRDIAEHSRKQPQIRYSNTNKPSAIYRSIRFLDLTILVRSQAMNQRTERMLWCNSPSVDVLFDCLKI
jgi:hypothetical protein